MTKELRIERSNHLKPKPNMANLSFGKYFTDHMFMMDYTEGNGWENPRIVPYAQLALDPAAMTFHYGQSVFEGLKAYKTEDERVLLFRPEKNIERLNRSSDRISIPKINEKDVLVYLKELVRLDQDWIPTAEGTSLYIRPFIFATEPNLSVTPSTTYTFMIILSPVGAYYEEGIHPVSIFVEDKYTRAVLGGTGTAKTAGNYAAAYKAQQRATEKGQSQVLWLDGIEKKYIEEVGSMNVFFKINDEVVTPALSGSILEGITRMTTIELLKDWGMNVVERRISMDELLQAYENGQLQEAFGTGTAAVISPIGEMVWKDKTITINNGETGELSRKLYTTLTGIQTGKIEDHFQWTVEV